MSSSAIKRCSISKQRGAEISSKLMPPKVGAIFFTVDAMQDCDVFVGVASANLVSKDMVKSMADNPIVFALSNPDPEISPADANSVRDDLIMATGRSDYPNQVNNVLGFPFIFRGALDAKASTINIEMKIAAVYALKDLAKLEVPAEVPPPQKAIRHYPISCYR
jgi:malic enzyme